MPEVPPCMHRRYKVLDSLIKDLSSHHGNYSNEECNSNAGDPGIKLMCEFWNILKEDPDCDLPRMVHRRLCPDELGSRRSGRPCAFNMPQNITCLMAGQGGSCGGPGGSCSRKSSSSSKKGQDSCKFSKQASESSAIAVPVEEPLSRVLCDLKEAAAFDKKCSARLAELLEAEEQLQRQVAQLEEKEKNGAILMKKADNMWAAMENAYKEKIAESLQRRKCVLDQLKEIEKSVAKWKKNKKDLESQVSNIQKKPQETNEKINTKTNDLKTVNVEIVNFNKRISANKQAAESIKNSLGPMKEKSDKKIKDIESELKRLQDLEQKELKQKKAKEDEGAQYIKEAREDLQKICKNLLQKKLEKEDLLAEKNSLLQEIEILQNSQSMCKEKCKKKQESLGDQINQLDAEIDSFQLKCQRCNMCTDTQDQRLFCNDCPRCRDRRECAITGEECTFDPTQECVCQTVKQKFLDNVFENMYIVLENQTQSDSGKAIADEVLRSVRNSRNGKLSAETRFLLQDFILTTVKRNLNLTIVGGAVKTRCELEPEVFNQLMLCLKDLKPTRVPNAEKGTESKKDPCKRWGGMRECHCPRGPRDCACNQKGVPPPKSARRGQSGRHQPLPVDKEDQDAPVKCPNRKDKTCGLECALHLPDNVGAEALKWRPSPCAGPSCPFSKNVRAAQCVLGPEALSFDSKKSFGTKPSSFVKDFNSASSITDLSKVSPSMLKFKDELVCGCGTRPKQVCSCHKDAKQLKLDDPHLLHFKYLQSCLFNDLPCKKTMLQLYEEHKELQIISQQLQGDLTGSDYSTQKRDAYIRETLREHCGKEGNISKGETKSLRITYVDNSDTNVSGHPNSIADSTKTDKIPIAGTSQNLNVKGDDNLCFELSETSSGVALKVKPSVFDELNRRIIKNPSLNVYLRSIGAQKHILEFVPKKGSLRASVKRSKLGQISLIIYKNLSKYGPQSSFTNLVSEPRSRSTTLHLKVMKSIESSHSCESKKASPTNFDKNIFEEIQELINDTNVKNAQKLKSRSASKLTEKQSLEDCKTDTERRLEIKRSKNILLNVHGENGASLWVQTEIRKTLSGNVAICIQNWDGIGVMSDDSNERPVLLKRSTSGTYNLLVGKHTPDHAPNSVLRKTPSGEVLLVIMEPVFNSIIHPVKPIKQSNHKIFNVRVKSISSDETDLPASLKLTSSGNYIFVFDKEFEKHVNYSLEKILGPQTQCYVGVQRTSSHEILINLNDDFNKANSNQKNALLVKTPSGKVRLLVDGKVYDTLSQNFERTQSRKSLMAFDSLITTLSSPAVNIKNRFKLQKRHEDPLINNIQRNLPLPQPVKIKKTPSGQYAVVLSKEDKKSFLNDLRNYLTFSKSNLVPVKKTQDGEIIMALNSDDSNNNLYGLLKLTPSGNIYVSMDEDVLKKLRSPKGSKPNTMNDIGSHHIIKKNKRPDDKGVLTVCKGHPYSCTCNPSKCACRKLLECTDKFSNKKTSVNLERKKKINVKPCNPSRCLAACCPKNRGMPSSNLPCDCDTNNYSRSSSQSRAQTSRSVRENDRECFYSTYERKYSKLKKKTTRRNDSQCYYSYVFTDMDNPTKDENKENPNFYSELTNFRNSTDYDPIIEEDDEEIYEILSNPSLNSNAISSLFRESEGSVHQNYGWNFLPPQLPPFLSNYEYNSK